MRSRRDKPNPVPARFRTYKPADWPSGFGEWIAEREEWAGAQEPVRVSYADWSGRPCTACTTPLGDGTALARARREARLLDWHGETA